MINYRALNTQSINLSDTHGGKAIVNILGVGWYQLIVSVIIT